jgi:hypothetical protein
MERYTVREAVLDRAEVAAILRCTERYVTTLARRGLIPAPWRRDGKLQWCQYRVAEWILAGCPGGNERTSKPPEWMFSTVDRIAPLLTSGDAPGTGAVRVRIGPMVRWRFPDVFRREPNN